MCKINVYQNGNLSSSPVCDSNLQCTLLTSGHEGHWKYIAGWRNASRPDDYVEVDC